MKIKNNSKFNKLLTVILCISLLTACNTNSQTNDVGKSQETNEYNVSTVSSDNAEINNTELFEYDEDDYYINWADQNPNYIKLNGSDITVDGSGATVNESVVKINKAGVYVISGKLDNGQIIVDTEDKETVRLVLNGAEIDCADNSPIYVINSEKTVISLEDGTENTVSDGENYVLVDSSSDEPSAAIFSKDDLTLNGTGTLTVVGNYNDGITSKDDLRITGGNIVINSKDDALVGKDVVAVKDGSFIINAGGKGIKSTNDADTEAGIIYLEGGTYSIEATDDGIHAANGINIANGEFTISTEDDGIHSDSFINISDGAIDIKKSYEGIESSQITVTGGDINIISSDDGINASSGDSSDTQEMPGSNDPNSNSGSDNKITINGGTIIVNAMGDGLDSNGSIYMTGGAVTVYGPTSNGNGSIDYDREFNITGGTLVAIGSSGMAQTPSDDSTQNSVMINFTELKEANSKISLKDSEGNIILTFNAEKQYQSIVMSSPDIKTDKSYTLFIGDTSIVTFTMSKSIMRISETGEEITGGGMNQMPGRGNGNGGNMPPQGGNGNMPDPNGNMSNNGERPEKPGFMDGTTQKMPEPTDVEASNSEDVTENTNN